MAVIIPDLDGMSISIFEKAAIGFDDIICDPG